MRHVTDTAVRRRLVLGRLEAQQRERRRQEHDPPGRGRVDDAQQAERDLRQPAPVGAREALEVLGVPDPVELLRGQRDLRPPAWTSPDPPLGSHSDSGRLDQLHACEGRASSSQELDVYPLARGDVAFPRRDRASASAPSIEVSTCDICAFVSRATQPSSPCSSRTRTIWSRFGLRRSGSPPARRGARAGVGALEGAHRGAREQVEGDHRRDRVAWQPEHERPVAAAEPRRLARLKPHAPEALLDAERGERGLHVVVASDRHAAGHAHDVRLAERRRERRVRRVRVIRHVAALHDLGADAHRLRGDAVGVRVPDLARGPGRRRARRARRPSRAPRPAGDARTRPSAARAMRAPPARRGRSRCRPSRTVSPARTSSPARRMFAPASVSGTTTSPSCSSVRSTGTTPCVPSGTTAPVEMRHAVPGASGAVARRAARDSATIRSGPRPRRAPRSRPSPRRRTAAGPGPRRSVASTRPSGADSSTSSLGAARTAASALAASSIEIRSRRAHGRIMTPRELGLEGRRGWTGALSRSSSPPPSSRTSLPKSACRQSASYAAATISVPDEPSSG